MTAPVASVPEPSLILGTVQLGMAYGVANRTGRPDIAAAHRILDHAAARGVAALDTARAYGDSESVIGAWLATTEKPLPVITKLAPLTRVAEPDKPEAARRSLAVSREALGLRRLGLVLAHREDDVLSPGVRDVLEEALSAGQIGAWGVSATRPEALARVLDAIHVAAVQLPASIADRRYRPLAEAARRAGAVVYARSLFLQGALLMPEADLPDHLRALAPGLASLDELARRLDRPRSDIALAAMRAAPFVDAFVVGVDTLRQLDAHLDALSRPALPRKDAEALAEKFSGLPDEILDPGLWPR